LLVIVGPTASGKSRLAVELASWLDGEIVSADSRYIYRGMDIGTAKPSEAERALVPHHLIDVVDPDQEYSLARYVADATATIRTIHSHDRLPLLVGGTGLYIRAVTRGFLIPPGDPDQQLRAELEEIARSSGSAVLHAELARLDPVAASRIDARNVRRVIRAIEVCRSTGAPYSSQTREAPHDWQILTIGLTYPREELYRRIDRRYDEMVTIGWIEEVARLLASGYPETLPSMTSLGYREIAGYLRGEMKLSDALQQIKFQAHRYVRQQYTWFRPDDPSIHWFVPDANTACQVVQLAKEKFRPTRFQSGSDRGAK
jgi:tRNA dimethylallyltransferase